jgi:hypothetical protein
VRGGGQFLGWVARARAVPIGEEILRRGINLKRVGAEFVGPCPRCGGEDRFAVHTKKNIFNCRGCSVGGDVIKLVEHLDGVDFNAACTMLAGPQPKANGKDRPGQAVEIVVAEFQYHDADWNTLLVVERIEFQKFDGSGFILEDGKRKKTFRQKRPDPNNRGKWIYNADGVPALPYRLPQLIEAIATDHPVLIVEGEAKADLLWSWNVAATCCVGGAKKWKPEHSEFLRGADVFLVPDNDNAGWQHVHKIGASLIGIAKRIRVLVLSHAKAKDDIIDWAKAGGTREQLDALLNDARDWTPPAAEETEKGAAEEKDTSKNKEDELVAALAKLRPGIDFHRQRDEAAKELKVSKAAIDAEIKARREAVPLHGHWIVEPWEGPVDGDSLLRYIVRRIRRHIVCSFDDALVIALWVVFSWVHEEAAIHSPILLITSAEPESGKTTTLNLASYLAPRAIASVEISKAALYRAIQLWHPSFIIDEFDSVLAAKDGDKAELRAVINSGHTRGQGVIRCITDEHRPELFSTFAPKAIGMIGRKMPAQTLGRCIIIELRRRTKDETIERFAHKDDVELGELRRRLRCWAMDNADSLQVEVSMPQTFDNRRADNWRVLLAIADLCSGTEDWGDKARAAATKVEGASDTSSIGVRLLADIKRVFDEDKCEVILSATLVVRLKEDQEAPWAEWSRSKGLTQNSLAVLLGGGGGRGRGSRGGFGIRSGEVHPSRDVLGKGYKRSQFEEAWSRYLPDETTTSSQGGE